MANNREHIPDEQRPAFGQIVPLGESEDGNTGVLAVERGLSNRPGDHAPGMAAQDEEEDQLDDEEDADTDDEDAEDADVEDDDEEDVMEDDDSEVTDPGSEPGKPI